MWTEKIATGVENYHWGKNYNFRGKIEELQIFGAESAENIFDFAVLNFFGDFCFKQR